MISVYNTTNCVTCSVAATICTALASGDLNSHPVQSVDLDLWPFDLGSGVKC